MTVLELLQVSALLAAVVSALCAWLAIRRKQESVRVSGDQLAISGKVDTRPVGRRFSSAECDIKHEAISRELSRHTTEITELWNTMRKEDQAIRSQFQAVIYDKIDDMKSELLAAVERNRANLDEKITELTAAVARVDERTHR